MGLIRVSDPDYKGALVFNSATEFTPQSSFAIVLPVNTGSSAQDSESMISLIVGRLARLQGVRRVWLFGSLAKGRAPDWRSDDSRRRLSGGARSAERCYCVWQPRAGGGSDER